MAYEASGSLLVQSGMYEHLAQRITQRTARAGVIGLGYVGLPLAVEIAKVGFDVIGLDMDPDKVEFINDAVSYIPDVSSEDLAHFVSQQKIRATDSLDVLDELDTISICVPTPLRKSKDPDLSYVIAAVEGVRDHLRAGQLIILESTTYPGTTRELVLPLLEETGLKAGQDFWLAFSPERVDPGNPSYNTHNIPKVIGGMTPACTSLAQLFYGQFIENLVPVSSPDSAEMVKLLENTFRSVNIALANEVAMMCHKLGVDVWEVIEAAKTKPFGFMPFYPGPGLGGHCIPVDPHYLTWKAKMHGFEPRLIEIAGHINSQMPNFTVSLIADALNERGKCVKGSKILALGVAYKRDTSDVRESPAIEVLRALRSLGAEIEYADPFVAKLEIDGATFHSVTVNRKLLHSVDCCVILTDHSDFDFDLIADHARLIVDSRNVIKGKSKAEVVSL
jgi:UDP-N-acetyl-D-glucosamine dehydrogenase